MIMINIPTVTAATKTTNMVSRTTIIIITVLPVGPIKLIISTKN